ncbi:hypothetical protein H4R18_000678 [Coemansia javaensis]|uniref:HAD family phosphatase n=1 Tax=Coemansia javaensis TaxID=2761396 RepID=A0A9W8LMR1_9FUNG|nr:hypothetical protein H4R18_000678 [Coemansia javaensis]
MERIRAVIFDVGGVVVGSPFVGIAAYEREHGLPANYVNVALSRRGAAGAFQRYERGEIGYDEFAAQWAVELNDKEANSAAYRAYLERRGADAGAAAVPPEAHIDVEELFARMMDAARTPNACVVDLVRWLRGRGYRVAALTNNFKDRRPDAGLAALLGDLFDEVVESSAVGLRKPDPAFYLLACRRLGIRPSEAVFLDDIGANLRAAERLGMAAVRVRVGHEPAAVAEVRRLVAARGAPRL